MTKECAFDIETTGFLKYEGDQIFSYSITTSDGDTIVNRLDGKDKKANLKYLQDFFNNTTIAKIAHNAKFELSFLRAVGINVPENTEWHDTMIMSQMLDNLCQSHALDNLAWNHFKYPKDKDEAIKKEIAAFRRKRKADDPENCRLHMSGYQAVNKAAMDEYQIADTERTMLLYLRFREELIVNKPMWLDYLHEIQLIKATVRMEEFGILLDVNKTNKIISFMSKEMDAAQVEIAKIHGSPINVNSTKQMADFVYGKLGNKCKEFTKKGAQSVSKDVLIDLRENDKAPIYEHLLKVRAYDRGISTLESYKDLAHPLTNRMHPNLKTNFARTGRQSCADPNLQNVSTKVSVRSIFGVPARQCFRADPGYVLIFIDYAGIELRLIVDACGEDEFIDAINTGKDVHDMASSVLYGDHWDEICQLVESPAGVKIPGWVSHINPEDYNHSYKSLKKTMRDAGKAYEFGIAYGGSYEAITATLVGLDSKQKKRGSTDFGKRWPRLSGFTKDLIEQVKKTGYVETAFGRKLYVDQRKAYTAANYKIQGTAAGILKRGQTRVDKYSLEELNNEVRVVLSVHDEIVLAYPRVLLPQNKIILPKIYELMTTHPEIRVKMEVEADITSTNWESAKVYHL